VFDILADPELRAIVKQALDDAKKAEKEATLQIDPSSAATMPQPATETEKSIVEKPTTQVSRQIDAHGLGEYAANEPRQVFYGAAIDREYEKDWVSVFWSSRSFEKHSLAQP
jgi:hypothetical protein